MTAKLAHFEILGADDKALVAFYRDLLDWQTDDRGPGYTLIRPMEDRTARSSNPPTTA